MRDFRKLQVWEKSHHLVLTIYRSTREFPKEEMYGLTSQIRRAALSIPTNIAEGSGRDSNPDFLRFLHMAMGSASELDYLLQLTCDLEYIDQNNYENLSEELTNLRRMLNAFIQKIKS